MPIQIRVVIPNASPGEEDSTGVGEKPDPLKKSVPRKNCLSAKTVRQNGRFRPASAPVSRVQLPVKPNDVTMHVASIYDVENEHDYIMDKALQAYQQYCQSEGVTMPSLQEHSTSPPPPPPPPPPTTNHRDGPNPHPTPRWLVTSPRSPGVLSKTSSTSSLSSSWSDRQKRGFKLALCTLKDSLGKDLGPVPHSHSSPGPGFLPLHRPWSACPQGRLDAIREVSLANGAQQQQSVKTAGTRPVHQHRLHVRTLPLPSKMDSPISRSAAYNLRNRTAHAWSPDPDPVPPSSPDCMTMSCPSPRSLEEHIRSARTCVPRDPNPSPVVVKGRAVMSPSSPQSRDRPSSAYSYDGGLFLSAGSFSSKDYFVIHPDWVSEAMTVQKLSLNERQGRPQSRSSGLGSSRRGWGKEEEEEEEMVGRRRSRRCKSAPPTKYRNPITWSS